MARVLRKGICGWLDGARERENVDPRGARPAQDPRASFGRRPRGDHIVDDDDLLSLIAPARAFGTLKAPATLRRRWSGESPTWLMVCRTRASAEQSTGTRASWPTSWASIAD